MEAMISRPAPALRPHVGVLMALLVGVAAVTAPLAAQGARHGSSTDAVLLQVRPRVGDTLFLTIEQHIEVSGRPTPSRNGPTQSVRDTPPPAPAPREPEIGPRRALAKRITRMLLFAHSFVEASDLSTTTLLATTDSLATWVGTTGATMTAQRMMLTPDGRQIRVRVTPDGAMRLDDPPQGAMALGESLAEMPGMLPGGPVRVGAEWERDIPIPSVPVSGLRADGVVRAHFRLDSLTRRGRIAWISLTGTLRRDGASRDLPSGTRVVTAGTLQGVLVVDRDRAWIVDASTIMDVQSDVSGGTAPVLLDIRVQQRMRVR